MNENKISTKHYIIFIYAVTFVSLKIYCSQFITIGGRDKEEDSYNINFHYDKYYFFYSKLFNIKHIF